MNLYFLENKNAVIPLSTLKFIAKFETTECKTYLSVISYIYIFTVFYSTKLYSTKSGRKYSMMFKYYTLKWNKSDK